MEDRTVKVGDYVVITDSCGLSCIKQVQNEGSLQLGKRVYVPWSAVIGVAFGATLRCEGGRWSRHQRLRLEIAKDGAGVEEVDDTDNRNLVDNNTAQQLSATDIQELKDTGISSRDLVKLLAEKSQTFHSKTAFSQEKYMKKKQKKHIQEITVRRATLLSIAETLYSKNPQKICALRFPYVGALLGYANLQPPGGGIHVVIDHSMGLVAGAVVTKSCDKDTVILVEDKGVSSKVMEYLGVEKAPILKRMPMSLLVDENPCSNNWLLPPSRAEDASQASLSNYEAQVARHGRRLGDFNSLQSNGASSVIGVVSHVKGSTDAFSLVRKCVKIANAYLKPGGRLVLYTTQMQPLVEAQCYLQESRSFTLVRLEEYFCREQQALEGRSHPQMQSTVQLFGGFLLSAVCVSDKGRPSSADQLRRKGKKVAPAEES